MWPGTEGLCFQVYVLPFGWFMDINRNKIWLLYYLFLPLFVSVLKGKE